MDGMVDSKVLDEVIRRVVRAAQPEKIIFVGSAGRDRMRPHSDLDLLVVKGGAHRRKLAQGIYEELCGVGAAVDVVVVTPRDLDRYKDSHALVVKLALREGKLVYADGLEVCLRRSARVAESREGRPRLDEPVSEREHSQAVKGSGKDTTR